MKRLFLLLATLAASLPGVDARAADPMTRDDIINLAKSAMGYSYWWGYGRWRSDGSDHGSCSGNCPGCTHSGSHGADCSGLAGKVWQVPNPIDIDVNSHPYSTVDFRNATTHWSQINRADLLRGDALVYNTNGAGHIYIYESGDPWGSHWAYECKGCSYGCVHNVRTGGTAYIAIRRDLVVEPPSNHPPRGYLDAAGCDAISGWSQDTDEPAKAIDVHLYFGGPAGSGAPAVRVVASQTRADLCSAIGSCDHGFSLRAPLSLCDGAAHEVHAYGIDSQGGNNPELSDSPKTLKCPTALPAGVRRHVTDPTVYDAWKLDAFMDLMTVGDAVLDALPVEVDIAPAPVLVRADSRNEVYLVDHGYRRWVPSPTVADNWHLDLGTVQVKSAAEVDGYPEAPSLRPRPVLVRGSGPAVWLVDDALPGADAGAPGPDASAPVVPDDAGTPVVVADDAGTEVVVVEDAGLSPGVDSGSEHPKPGLDAGPALARRDAGAAGAPAVGSAFGCSASAASELWCALGALSAGLFVRRRRGQGVQ